MYILNKRRARMKPWCTPKNISAKELYEQWISVLASFHQDMNK